MSSSSLEFPPTPRRDTPMQWGYTPSLPLSSPTKPQDTFTTVRYANTHDEPAATVNPAMASSPQASGIRTATRNISDSSQTRHGNPSPSKGLVTLAIVLAAIPLGLFGACLIAGSILLPLGIVTGLIAGGPIAGAVLLGVCVVALLVWGVSALVSLIQERREAARARTQASV